MTADLTKLLTTPKSQRERAELLDAAARLLTEDGGPGGFVLDLFGRVPPSDLSAYPASILARLASSAHRRLARPRPSEASWDLHLDDVVVERDGRVQALTVVEAVNPNRPFLLDSVLAELYGQGLMPLLVAHPILGVDRDDAGGLVRVEGETTANAQPGSARESLIHIHLDGLDGDEARTRLREGLARVLRHVALVDEDRDAMAEALATLARGRPDPRPSGDRSAATRDFLEWLLDGNFLLLGIDERPDQSGGASGAGRSLGILRDPEVEIYDFGRSRAGEGYETRALSSGAEPLIVSKAAVRSTVHRSAYLDTVGLRSSRAGGVPAGVVWLVGLFTASAYAAPTRDVPLLRQKFETVVERAGLDPTSHAGRMLAAVLEAYPRDELFQTEADHLLRSATSMMELADRPRMRVLVRPDPFGRFVSSLTFVPKDRYDTNVLGRVGDLMARSFGGTLAVAEPTYVEGPLVRIHCVVRTATPVVANVDEVALERAVSEVVRTWADALRDVLSGEDGGRTLAARYAKAFTGSYRERFTPGEALADVAVMERLDGRRQLSVGLDLDPGGEGQARVRLKVYSLGAPLPLSRRVPALETFGFQVLDERTYRVTPDAAGRDQVLIHDMLLESAVDRAVVMDRAAAISEALVAVAEGRTESDRFNRLVVEAGMTWREAAVMRALARYLRQLRIRYGQGDLASALTAHPRIARALMGLFQSRFDPSTAGQGEAERRAEVEALLAGVDSLNEDRILRRFLNLLDAAVRTNFFQRDSDGAPRETLSLKFLCSAVTGMPLPRPFFETFVHSPRIEGVHLRYGHVARGGIRWSDRPEDYRTEVLGLVKAQQVKNAVIVPVGAKGGFVARRLPDPSNRAAWLAEGTESYRAFIRALLDVTDNIVGGEVRPPPDTRRHDGDDAYLVVAADKGTATFSDVANAISVERGHWLGDAFASGGGRGYDHKAMGITARGAWEAVRRHFRELDLDVQTDPITVVGVGDMSGDVFGNGMLLSRSLRLVAAFDHRSIFVDPRPDPERGFAERRRLFDLPRSGWDDYDRSAMSAGGGVFARTLKAVPLSPEARAALGMGPEEVTPAEVIQAILRAPVDLLWFGGIGTYVRATTETDEEVGDRSNDPVRVAAADLRAKVVAEGANLGLTQRGRVEAAQTGVRLNTDAIDNSAGVNTSDLEVNIKIALMAPRTDGRLDDLDRDAMLASMTEEVSALVLRNNALQALALSLAEHAGGAESSLAARTLEALEVEGRLDRAVERLPGDAQLRDRIRNGEGLTRPELAVLLAYAKLSLNDALLGSDVVDDPYFVRELRDYFPSALRDRFPGEVEAHRLRREIVATQLSNAVVNHGGPSLVTRLVDEAGTDAATVARAYAIVRDAFDLPEVDRALAALSGVIPGGAHLDLCAQVRAFLGERVAWFVRSPELVGDLPSAVHRFGQGAAAIDAALPRLTDQADARVRDARAAELVGWGMSATHARRLANLDVLAVVPDAVLVGEASGCTVLEAARALSVLDRSLGLGALERAAWSVPAGDTFDRIAMARSTSSISTTRRALCVEALSEAGMEDGALERWCAARSAAIDRARGSVAALAASGLTVAKTMVAVGLLQDMLRIRDRSA